MKGAIIMQQPKKYTKEQIDILRNQQFTIFDEKELSDLENGTASFKLMSNADKTLDKLRGHFSMAMPRGEVLRLFNALKREIFAIQEVKENMFYLLRALFRKNVISQKDLDNARRELIVIHAKELCESCEHDPVRCFADPAGIVTAGEIVPDIDAPGKIVGCGKYKGRK
jgi:hypothetical protein